MMSLHSNTEYISKIIFIEGDVIHNGRVDDYFDVIDVGST